MGKSWRISKIQDHGGLFRDLKIENDEKEYQILIVFYDFEKLKGYLLSMNWNFLYNPWQI